MGSRWRTVPAVKLLFIGDIVGKPGRRAVRYFLPRLRKSLGIDFVVANGENMAGGSGITASTAVEVFEAGVDVMTSGDHLWDQREVESMLLSESRLVRPENYPEGTPGQGYRVFSSEGLPPLGVLNLQGQTFMRPVENPFFAAEYAVEELRKETPVIFVDMHAEATSEKIGMGRFLDGKVSAERVETLGAAPHQAFIAFGPGASAGRVRAQVAYVRFDPSSALAPSAPELPSSTLR